MRRVIGLVALLLSSKAPLSRLVSTLLLGELLQELAAAAGRASKGVVAGLTAFLLLIGE